MKKKILVIGAAGQIGVEMVLALRERHGEENVIASDVCAEPAILRGTGPWERIDAMNEGQVYRSVARNGVGQVYLLAAMLSARGEKDPHKAWQLNMGTLLNVLEIAKEEGLQVFWPSSIAADTPTSTVYGISKYAGECWCQWYHDKHGVDVRSLRYPGLISYKTKPGGGTTDYAIDIFHAALAKREYECFLKADTMLPMMYMEDAVRATLQLMEAPAEQIRNRMSYAIGALSFTPAELYAEIVRLSKGFKIRYAPDHRQQIAQSWPREIDDAQARADWGWKPEWTKEDLLRLVNDMLVKLEETKMAEVAHAFQNMEDL